MAVITSMMLAYLGCGLFFQASAKRTTLGLHISQMTDLSQQQIWLVRAAGFGTLSVSLTLCVQPQGFERGFAIWLGIVCAVGFVSVFISAVNRHAHIPSLGICSVVAVVLLLFLGASA